MLACTIASTGQTQNWLWTKASGGGNSEEGQNVATDHNGNVYITGFFASPAITFGSFVLTNSGVNDAYLAKYDSTGNVLWAVKIGNSGDDKSYGICTDKNNNVIIVGNFTSGSLTIGNVTLSNPGYFVAKFDPSGNVLFARGDGGSIFHSNYGNCIAADTNSNIVIVGTFTGTVHFGGSTLVNIGNPDIFTVKCDPAGNVLWAKQGDGGTYDNDLGNGITTDKQGNVYITGGCGANTVFGSILTGVAGIFIVKYSSSGAVSDVRCTSGGTGRAITADPSGNVFVAGVFNTASLTFGGSTVVYNSNPGTSDILLVTYMNPPAVWSIGGPGIDDACGITTDQEGNVYVSGMFRSSSITFPLSTTLTNSVTGSADIWVAKYVAGFNFNLTAWARSATGENDQGAYGIAVDNHDHTYITGAVAGSPIFDNDTVVSAGGNDVFLSRLGCEPLQPGPVTGPNSICRYSQHTYSVNPVPSATVYNWTLSGGFSGNSTSPSILVTAGTTNGTITVAAHNGCGTGRVRTLDVSVNPATPTINPNGPASFCAGNSVVLTASGASAYLWSDGATNQNTTVSTSGNYTVTITDQNGCTAGSLPVSVTVYPNPPVPSISQAGNVLFSSSPAGNQWYFNNSLLPGQTGQVCIPNQNGKYTVSVTDGNGCSSISSPYNFVFVGMDNNKEPMEMEVFPNPSQGKFLINFSEERTGRINLVNQMGTIIYTRDFKNFAKIEIDINDKPDGFYFLQVQTVGINLIRKIIKTQNIK